MTHYFEENALEHVTFERLALRLRMCTVAVRKHGRIPLFELGEVGIQLPIRRDEHTLDGLGEAFEIRVDLARIVRLKLSLCKHDGVYFERRKGVAVLGGGRSAARRGRGDGSRRSGGGFFFVVAAR